MKKAICCIVAMSIMAPALAVAAESSKGMNVCATGAAHLESAKGVLLSHGASFSEINSGAKLSVGDRILVREGSANIVIGDAVSHIGPDSMMMLTKKGALTCATQVSSNPGVVAAADSTGGLEPFWGSGGVDPLWVIGGLAVVGAGVGIGLATSSHGGNNSIPFISIPSTGPSGPLLGLSL
jgi:hypothetical protein